MVGLSTTVFDTSGMIRLERASLTTSIDGLGQVSQVMMVEYLKVVFPGPNIFTLQCCHCNALDMPVIVTIAFIIA